MMLIVIILYNRHYYISSDATILSFTFLYIYIYIESLKFLLFFYSTHTSGMWCLKIIVKSLNFKSKIKLIAFIVRPKFLGQFMLIFEHYLSTLLLSNKCMRQNILDNGVFLTNFCKSKVVNIFEKKIIFFQSPVKYYIFRKLNRKTSKEFIFSYRNIPSRFMVP